MKMLIHCYPVVLFQLMLTIDYGLTSQVGGGPTNGGIDLGWQDIISTHLCPLIACEDWCDCSDMAPQFSLNTTTVEVSDNCTSESFSPRGKLKSYTDCDPILDQTYFRWWPLGEGAAQEGRECKPYNMASTTLERVQNSSYGLYWRVWLSVDNSINVADLCASAPPKDSCSICLRPGDSITSGPTPRKPGEGTRITSPPTPLLPSDTTRNHIPLGSEAANSTDSKKSGMIPEEVRTAFIIGVGVGVAVAISFILVCCLVIHIRRKMNRNRHEEQQANRSPYQVGSNHYSTIERPLTNGAARAIFTISPQTSIDSGSPQRKKKMKKRSKKPLLSSNDLKLEQIPCTAYTEYYADRTASSYAGLQPVQSDSALASKVIRHSTAAPFNIFAEYQEPDLVMPRAINMCMFEDKRLSTSSSFNSFKLPGEYMDPEEVNVPRSRKPTISEKDKEAVTDGGSSGMATEHIIPKHFKQKNDDNNSTSSMWHGKRKGKQKKIETFASCKEPSSSNKPNPNSPDSNKDVNLVEELKATLNKKKKPVSKSESTPLEIENENPYAEVGDNFFSNDSPRVSRQRSHSQPMVSTLSGYRTYEEIKPRGYHIKNGEGHEEDNSVFPDANPYFQLEDPNASRTHYFELDNLNEATQNQQYFVLEKPNSLPLDTKKKKKRDESKSYHDQPEKTATLYQNDKCAVRGSGFRNKQFDLCVDSDSNKNHLTGISAKTPTYFQLETPRNRASLGSMAQEYMSSSDNEYNDRNNRVEGTLTFYPGGRQRSSTYSLEEQAYDRLNRSARSSRASNRRSLVGTPTGPDGPYGCISTVEDYNESNTTPTTKHKSMKKK